MRKAPFCKDICEEEFTNKITQMGPMETFNCAQLLPVSSNRLYATFLFLSAAQAKPARGDVHLLHLNGGRRVGGGTIRWLP
jgi:hypothetical protein